MPRDYSGLGFYGAPLKRKKQQESTEPKPPRKPKTRHTDEGFLYPGQYESPEAKREAKLQRRRARDSTARVRERYRASRTAQDKPLTEAPESAPKEHIYWRRRVSKTYKPEPIEQRTIGEIAPRTPGGKQHSPQSHDFVSTDRETPSLSAPRRRALPTTWYWEGKE